MPFERRQDEFAEAREAMVESQLRPQGIADPLVIEAMATVRRERFVPLDSAALAYSDRSVALGHGRSMMPPAALALLIQALEPGPGERALVVGAGTGYSSELLRFMGVEVLALEPIPELAAVARAEGIETIESSLAGGHKAGAPFDLILIDGAVEQVPEAIVAQLEVGGRLAAAILDRGVARLAVGTKSNCGFGLRTLEDAAVPRLPGFDRDRAFVF